MGFIADMRNHAGSPCIPGGRGCPEDVSEWVKEALTDESEHSYSWVALSELLAFDYDQKFFDQRQQVNTTLRDFLGPYYFGVLDTLQRCGADRIVFGFDS